MRNIPAIPPRRFCPIPAENGRGCRLIRSSENATLEAWAITVASAAPECLHIERADKNDLSPHRHHVYKTCNECKKERRARRSPKPRNIPLIPLYAVMKTIPDEHILMYLTVSSTASAGTFIRYAA